MSMLHIDDAIAEHLARPAMSGGDLLTDLVQLQFDACAIEGAQPPATYAAGQAPQPEHPGWSLLAVALLAVLAGACFFPWSA